MRLIGLFCMVALWVANAPVAYGDTDFKCLKDCTSSASSHKTTPQRCYKKCSYYSSDAKLKKLQSKNKSNAYDQFDNQLPGGRLFDSHKPEYHPPEMNYRCVDGCLKEGMQYQYCKGRCFSKK